MITNTNGSINTGYIGGINDSIIYVSPVSVAFNAQPAKTSQWMQIDYSHIKMAEIKRKGTFGRQFLSGAVIGTIAGAVIALVVIPDYNSSNIIGVPAGIRAGFGALTGFVAGGIIGGIKSISATKKFTINGKKDKFQNMQFRLTVMEKLYAR